MGAYRVEFVLRNGDHFTREEIATSIADAAFIGTLDLVHAINAKTGKVSLEETHWSTEQALALQVASIQVTEL